MFYKRISGPICVNGIGIHLVLLNHNAFTFAEIDRLRTSGHVCATFEINSAPTIEPLCIKQQREKWMCDKQEYLSIFGLIKFDIDKTGQSDYLLHSNCPKEIVSELFVTIQNSSFR